MTRLLLTIHDDRIDEADHRAVLDQLPDRGTDPPAATVTPETGAALLDTLPDDAIEIVRDTHHPDWEEGQPCPECGEEQLSVMRVMEDIYRSAGGEFEYRQMGEATAGPTVSVLCPNCMTELKYTPVSLPRHSK